MKNPYQVIKHQHVTEKTQMLESLKDNVSNPCIKRFEQPKYVFIVDITASKPEIKEALEEIYKEKRIKVKSVNTITLKPKKRRVRGRLGERSAFKKAIVTLEKGDSLELV